TLSAGGDVAGPSVVSTSVKPGEKRVSRTSGLTVYFSEPLAPATVNAKTVQLVSASGRAVKARVRYTALANSVTIKPDKPLGADSYSLVVDPTITDVAGNALGEPMTLSFSTVTAMASASPTAPGRISSVRPVGLDQVEITWTPALDDVGVTKYYVLRSLQPMRSGSYPGAETAAVVTGAPPATTVTTFTVRPTPSIEASKSYSYWYVVRAGDADGNIGDPSPMFSPNPHGMWYVATGYNSTSCTRCHMVHGGLNVPPKLAANSAGACYICHGGTPGNDAYGYGSTMDTQGDFNDDSVPATNNVGNGGWSIHRTSYMYQGDSAQVNSECVACHSPHRKAYDDNPALSFGRLLRKYASFSPTSSTYSTDTAPFGEDLCYSCHGTTSTAITRLAGAGKYDDTGGDHQTTYQDVAAHAPATVKPMSEPNRANGAALPKIACLACHDKHAASSPDLVDWRESGDKTGKWAQAAICLECHTGGAGLDARAETQSVGAAPFSWNGRDVKAEFARASRHPSTVGGGVWVPKSGTVFSQTSDVEFTADARTNVVANLGLNAATLDQYVTVIQPPDEALIVGTRGTGGTNADAYEESANAWNGVMNPNVVPWTPGAGSTSFVPTGGIMWL
ncbi:MAG TPA: Ig-like domain-containing protein, partial [Coriobacteriia bacterium]